ncbi:RHS repeat protein [Trichlorobacter lovleyi]|nr:RHS repeat protein [Trichlorobacter lovleyi]
MPPGNATSYSYDCRGQQTSETDPLNKTTSYGYGATPLPTSRTDANGQSIIYSCDPLQRQT